MKLVVFFYCGCSVLVATSLLENGNMIIASCTCFGLSMEFIQFIVFFGFKRLCLSGVPVSFIVS